MLTKKITYEDFDGVQREETHYFNISKSELTALELSVNGGLSGLLQQIAETRDVPEVIKLIEKFISLSYGKKSLDGRKFEKKPEYFEDFKSTNAYDVLFMELISDANVAADFISAIVPTDVATKAKEIQTNSGVSPTHPALNK